LQFSTKTSKTRWKSFSLHSFIPSQNKDEIIKNFVQKQLAKTEK